MESPSTKRAVYFAVKGGGRDGRHISKNHMDYKDIVEKAVKGEDYSALVSTLTEEQKVEADKAIVVGIRKVKEDELASLKGIREEKNRISAIKTEAETGFKKFQDTQKANAKTKFFADFNIKPEQQAEYEKHLETVNDADQGTVYNSLKRYYATLNADELLDARQKNEEFKKNAVDLNFQMAGGSAGGGSPDPDKYSPEARALAQQAAKKGIKIDLDAAEVVVKEGLVRKLD